MANYANEWYPRLSSSAQAILNNLVVEYRAPYGDTYTVTEDNFIQDIFYMNIHSLNQMRNILKHRMREAASYGSYWIEIWFNVLKGQIDPRLGTVVAGTEQHWTASHTDDARGSRRTQCCQWMGLKAVMVSDAASNRRNEQRVLSQLNLEAMRQKLQNFAFSRTQLLGVTGMRIKTTRTNFAMGAPIELPEYLMEKARANCFLPMKVSGNLCFWACLAIAKGCRVDCPIQAAKKLLKLCGGTVSNYPGFRYSEEALQMVERVCRVSINIYTTQKDEMSLLRRGSLRYMKVHINRYETHFSLITDLRLYGGIYRCPNCPKLFHTKKGLYQHERGEQCAAEPTPQLSA